MTDHHLLKYLDTQRTLSRRQARWVEFMQELDYCIDYIKGKLNIVVDALSRRYGEVHHTSSNIVKQIIAFTMVNVIQETLRDLQHEYENDESFK